jgi:hypothetical protein
VRGPVEAAKRFAAATGCPAVIGSLAEAASVRRIGLSDRIAEAHRMLPEVVDLDRDGQLLSGLGLSMDRIVDGLGAGPW